MYLEAGDAFLSSAHKTPLNIVHREEHKGLRKERPRSAGFSSVQLLSALQPAEFVSECIPYFLTPQFSHFSGFSRLILLPCTFSITLILMKKESFWCLSNCDGHT